MSKEVLMVVDAVSNEKGVESEIIFEAIEAALAMATKRLHNENMSVEVVIDRKSGEYETFRVWNVVDYPDLEDPESELTMVDAVDYDENAQVGDVIKEPMDSVEFGRIAAQTAKQVIVQKVREAERAQIVELYEHRKGELITGVVKRLDKGGVILDMGNHAEASITRENMIPREAVRPGDRIRGLLFDVRAESRGPLLHVSRSHPDLLIELFKLEVPEVGDDVISIISAARDPGVRAKIAVRSNDDRIDPVGACVGMRGSRVQSVSNELAGERVDIILWDENPAQFVINAMSPAEVSSIVVDEDAHSMDIAVIDEQLSQAIGRNGQNIRLATELTGWTLNVMGESQAAEQSEMEAKAAQALFVDKLDADEDVAAILYQEGFSSIEEIAYVPHAELLEIEEFDEGIVEELRNRARDVLLTQEISKEEHVDDKPGVVELIDLDGMDETLYQLLTARGINSWEDLAELSIDDFDDVDGVDEARAGALIMAARAPWFAEESNK
ncbi:MAG: transcription termination factor NusA [Gammaproteobacteria bacterium]|nr:transcription termination factor NusA [Gammaproteobacteria bacterium]MCF6229506.1 transcription termination factor NusA [Gammaproteobacteria bacterium]